MCSGDAVEVRLVPRWRGAVGTVEGWRCGWRRSGGRLSARPIHLSTVALATLHFSTFPRGVKPHSSADESPLYLMIPICLPILMKALMHLSRCSRS